MSTLPIYELELRASDQRRRLAASVAEFNTQVRERLNIDNAVREHLGLLSGIVAAFAFASAYAVTGLFTRH